MLLLCAVLAAAGADDARLLTGLVASAAADDPRADVLTAADLKSAIEVETQKQLLACDASQSCLAEIAAALDAAIVVSGTLGQLDDERVLQLSAFDAKKASSAGRATARATTTKALATQAEAATKKLVAQALSSAAPGTRVRILILDVESVGAAGPPPETQPSPFGVLSLAGGAVGVVGALGIVVGVGAGTIAADNHAVAKNVSSRVVDARAAADGFVWARAFSVGGYIVGGVAFAGAAALVTVDVVGGVE